MSENNPKQPFLAWLRWRLFDLCLAYCIRSVHPDADSKEFSIIDNANFVAVSIDEIKEIIEEAPEIAWRFGVVDS